MASLGGALLGLAFLAALAAGALALAGRNGDERLLLYSRRTVYAFCGLLTACVVIIELAFARNDFSFNIVQQHSSIETPAGYKLAAMWSSQEGSLLLWAFVLSIAASVALFATRDKLRDLVPWATAVMMGVAAFFTGLMLFAPDVDPFATALQSQTPTDGIGLNPLLQHPSMMIHPPMLYSGYVAFTVPFAFAIGALVTRRLDAEWIRATRRFALIAWTFLGFGLLLGARWSYTELGWGGYWAWDPVENAALMPWLLGTAFLHSIMVQEKRGMLKVWNATPDRRHLLDGAARHLPRPLRRPAVDPRLRRQHRRPLHPRPDRRRPDRLDGADRQPPRRPALAEADRLAGLARVGLPGQQPAPGRDDRGDLLGHLLPADLRTLHRREGLAGCALVRPLHDAAGDPARPLHRDRAAARLAAGQLGVGEAGLPAAARGRRRGRPRARPLHRRRRTALGAGALHLRRLCHDRAGAGVLDRRCRAQAAQRRVGPPGAGRPRQPQPPSLRRLHRPRRRHRPADRHRRLLQLPDQPRRRAATGGEHHRRRPHDHLREADRGGRRGEVHLRLGAADRRRRQGGRRPATEPALLPADRAGNGDDRQLLRRRGDQRGGAADRLRP